MKTNKSFSPSWTSPPGDTIKDILVEKEMSLTAFQELISVPNALLQNILNGEVEISKEIANKLASTLGGSESFWLTRDSLYSADVNRISSIENEDYDWLKKLPLKDIFRFNWINPRPSTKEDKLKACLDFFNVPSVDGWYRSYNNLLYRSAFRTTSSFDSQPESVVTWLRQGLIEAEPLNCSTWNKSKFASSLNTARSFSRIKDPKAFIPKLQGLFSDCGVALVIVRTPSKCHASGATLLIPPNKRLMILSFRYLTDDHFWFSLFHEAAHLLLHGDESLFLEGVNLDTEEESEANAFSANILIPDNMQNELRSLNNREWRKIVRFAKKVGVSSGIIVGQLQYLGIVKPNYLNKLKTRYQWETDR